MLRPSAYESRYDAVVVGARCAGAATAMLLARAGARVLLVDRDARGADTLSTHALMRTAVMLLHRWGVLPEVIASGAPLVRRTVFRYGAEELAIDVKARDGVEGLYAPRRTELDRLLADAAMRAGADVRYGVSLEDLDIDLAGRVRGAHLRDRTGRIATVRADLLVGADGRASTVARLVGAETYAQSRRRTSTVYGYFVGVPNDGYRWLYQPGAAAGVIPTNNGASCVFASVPPSRFHERFAADQLGGMAAIIAAQDEQLAGFLLEAGPQERLRRFGGAPGHLRQSHGPGWALVGDAGYFKDPVTAHGISDALRDAELLARAADERPRGGPRRLSAGA